MKKILIILMVLLLNVSLTYADGDFADTQIKVTPVAGTVYMLEGAGGNIGLSVGEDGVLMIDDQFAPLNAKIMAAIEGLSPEKVKYTINTHWHGDHTGGNTKMSEMGSTIIAHENVRVRLMEDQIHTVTGEVVEAQPKEAWPVITFLDMVSIHFNEHIDVIHFESGHTDGDSVIFFRDSNVIHMGDLFFNGWYPYVDLNAGGDVDGYIANIELVLDEIKDNDDVKIIPGHGPLGTKEDLMALHDLLVEVTEMVALAVDEGKTLEQVLEEGLPERITSIWGNGFLNTEKWLRILYKAYSHE